MVGLIFACVIGLQMSMPALERPASDPSTEFAQVLGASCKTEYGTCPIPPQPLNSVCFCGSAQGIVTE
jgi:hypothetical protein